MVKVFVSSFLDFWESFSHHMWVKNVFPGLYRDFKKTKLKSEKQKHHKSVQFDLDASDDKGHCVGVHC